MKFCCVILAMRKGGKKEEAWMLEKGKRRAVGSSQRLLGKCSARDRDIARLSNNIESEREEVKKERHRTGGGERVVCVGQ